MLGTMMLAGLGMALMRNPRRKRRVSRRRRNPPKRSGHDIYIGWFYVIKSTPKDTIHISVALYKANGSAKDKAAAQRYARDLARDNNYAGVFLASSATHISAAKKRIADKLEAKARSKRWIPKLDSDAVVVRRNPRRAKRRSKSKRRGKGWTRTTTVTKVTKMTRKNPRAGAKTKIVYVVQGNYGYGWDDENEEDNRVDARRSIKEYRDNGSGSYRLIRRRVKIETNPRRRSKRRNRC